MAEICKAADIANLARIAATGDPLDRLHRDIVGQSARIHIPLRDVPDLRRVATALRVLASRLEVLSQSKDADWHALYDARNAIKLADRLIREGR